jgi:alanine dehydrogenase
MMGTPSRNMTQNVPFVHAFEQASHGGELAAGVEAGVVTRDRVTDIGRVLSGDADGRRSAEEITLFDSTGLAIQDLAIAKAAAAKADTLDLQRLAI